MPENIKPQEPTDICPNCKARNLRAVCATLTTYNVRNETGKQGETWQAFDYVEASNEVGEIKFVICRSCRTVYDNVTTNDQGDILELAKEAPVEEPGITPCLISCEKCDDELCPKPGDADAFGWVITEDIIDKGTFNGTAGPSGMTLTPDAIKAHRQKRMFRLKDDDGIVYAKGWYVGPVDDRMFSPLSDFGEQVWGCTTIEYRDGLKWTNV